MKKKTNVETPTEGGVKPRRGPRKKNTQITIRDVQTPTEEEVIKPEAIKPEAIKPRRGPQKEKTQITIRVDTDLMNEAYALMKADNTRLTDIIERGIGLALYEANRQLSSWEKQVRFMVANTTKEQQGLIRGLLIAMVEPLMDSEYKIAPESDKKIFELLRWFLEMRNKTLRFNVVLEYYSRYGKSAEEMAELVNRKPASI